VSTVRTLKTAVKRMAGAALRWNGVVALNYHRIGDGKDSQFDRGLWSATADGFERQLRWLKANFDVVSPRDLPYVLRVKRGRHVLVTFDDGYEDNYTAAYPVLRAHRLPATFFVATGFIDHPQLPWWDEIAWMVRSSRRSGVDLPGHLPAPVSFDEPDRERAVRTLLRTYYDLPAERTGGFLDAVAEATGSGRYDAQGSRRIWMTWDMLREMYAGGMTIGGHTVHHPVLARMSRERQSEEIAGCGRRLEEELGSWMRTFAYPVGRPDSFNEDTRDCLRELGVRSAFSYYGGYRRLDDWDEYDIPRYAVEQHTSLDEFRAAVMAPWIGRLAGR
jgi:peptidoglycan/xylan/chitin deacetylase (PgdA/CDA1 family)